MAVANAKVGDWIKRKDGSIHVLTQQDIDWAKKKIPSKVDTTPTSVPVKKTKSTVPNYTPEEKQKLTVEQLLRKFEEASGEEFANDAAILG